jgi:hypothetical protein
MTIARLKAAAVGIAALAVVVSGLSSSANAQPTVLPRVVSDNPANGTPQLVPSGAVGHPATYAIEAEGSTTWVGGAFDTVSAGGQNVARGHLMAFNNTTGALLGLNPGIDGDVWALAYAGGSLYVGGFFTTVNGVRKHGIVKIDASTGAVDNGFSSAAVAGPVTEIRLWNGHLIVSGRFPGKLVSLNPATGANDHYMDGITVTGQVAGNSGPTRVYRFAIAGGHLVGVGNMTQVNGQTRARAFMLDLNPGSAALDPWYYQPLVHACAATRIPEQLRDVDFSSSGAFFVLFASGYVPTSTGAIGTDVCDAAARFETNIPAPPKPTWINYTGGDTIWSGAVTGNEGGTVYLQGHFRWLDNAGGRDACGPGCAPRQGIGAIDATTGKALPWNPGKTRAVGGKDLLVTGQGLWVGSDGALIGGERHYGIALMPEL